MWVGSSLDIIPRGRPESNLRETHTKTSGWCVNVLFTARRSRRAGSKKESRCATRYHLPHRISTAHSIITERNTTYSVSDVRDVFCRRDLRRDRAWWHLCATTGGARDSTWFFEVRVARLVNCLRVNSQLRGGWESQFCDLLFGNVVRRETRSAGGVGVPSSMYPSNPCMIFFLKSWLAYLRGPRSISQTLNTRKRG